MVKLMGNSIDQVPYKIYAKALSSNSLPSTPTQAPGLNPTVLPGNFAPQHLQANPQHPNCTQDALALNVASFGNCFMVH
ncbi:hypothetical protein STSP2_03011 [Anaerohalosphaera lusitana]|uniref:Uncharacterized protein n=1 Tax=Anaerohalosphaera lusitana TaxID=1936003 RepID=A0A1U9NQ08_9BACT|nr:hypothetical protein STSP2_03011 [Anaerohalosphaera lusitana]